MQLTNLDVIISISKLTLNVYSTLMQYAEISTSTNVGKYRKVGSSSDYIYFELTCFYRNKCCKTIFENLEKNDLRVQSTNLPSKKLKWFSFEFLTQTDLIEIELLIGS